MAFRLPEAAHLVMFGFASTTAPLAARDAPGIAAASAEARLPFRLARTEAASALRFPRPIVPPPATACSEVPPTISDVASLALPATLPRGPE